MRAGCIVLMCLLLNGCELLQLDANTPAPVESSGQNATTLAGFCVQPIPQDAVTLGSLSEHNCDLLYWLDMWAQAEDLSWSQRKKRIDELGESVPEQLEKVLLSQAKGTPYQNRLRAQGWLEQLLPALTEPMAMLMKNLVYSSSQQLLEFESALAILTRMNAIQGRQLDEQKERLLEQQQQIDALLKIEASMMETKEVNN